MNRFYKYLAAALVLTAAVAATSCSDDDPKVEVPSVGNVFNQGLPANVGGATFITNSKGQLTEIKDEGTIVTFEYGSFVPTRAHNFTVLMKVRDTMYPKEGSDIYMELNSLGFVAYAYQIDIEDSETDEWWFEYNQNGQLTQVKRTESGDNFQVTYSDGNIAKVVQDDSDNNHSEYTFVYTNSEFTGQIANKGNLMLFDNFFHIDMDEMSTAYFAGLLGKSTNNLPMGYSEVGVEDQTPYTYTAVYHWIFDANNLPIKFWEDDEISEAVTFSW